MQCKLKIKFGFGLAEFAIRKKKRKIQCFSSFLYKNAKEQFHLDFFFISESFCMNNNNNNKKVLNNKVCQTTPDTNTLQIMHDHNKYAN